MTYLPTPVRSAKAAVAAAVPLAMLGGLLAAAPSAVAVAPDSAVFINELHYDNAGGDVGEFVEVAGPAGTDLTGWRIVPYNGSGGATYTPRRTLDRDAGRRHGHRLRVQRSRDRSTGLQNGAPDGARAGRRLWRVGPVPVVRGFIRRDERPRRRSDEHRHRRRRGRQPVPSASPCSSPAPATPTATSPGRRRPRRPSAPRTTTRSSSRRATRCRPRCTCAARGGHDHR